MPPYLRTSTVTTAHHTILLDDWHDSHDIKVGFISGDGLTEVGGLLKMEILRSSTR